MKKPRKLPSKERLHELVEYNPEKGSFKNKVSGRQICKGSGWYQSIGVDGERYPAHRIAWKMCYGVDPDIVDHINGKGYDNRISNLRSVTLLDNSHNRKLNLRNYPGSHRLRKGVWTCKKTINHSSKHYGEYPCSFCAVMRFVIETANYWKNKTKETK